MKFNINHKVRVRLTDAGRKILADARDNLCRSYPNIKGLSRYPLADEDAGGWSQWQLWDLMARFGPHMRLGGPMLFETTIEIPDPAA